MCSPCSCDRHTPEIKLAEMRRHLSFGSRVPLDWQGWQGWLRTAHCFHKSLMNGWVTACCVSVRDKLTLFACRTADMLENKLAIQLTGALSVTVQPVCSIRQRQYMWPLRHVRPHGLWYLASYKTFVTGSLHSILATFDWQSSPAPLFEELKLRQKVFLCPPTRRRKESRGTPICVPQHVFSFAAHVCAQLYLFPCVNKPTVCRSVWSGLNLADLRSAEMGQFSLRGVSRLLWKRSCRFLRVPVWPVNGACLLPSITEPR